MTWPAALLAVMIAFAVVGVLCVVLIGVFWQSVGRVVSDSWVKIAVKLFQVPAGFVSLGGAYAAADKQEWWPAAVMGLACVLVWEVVEKLTDNRVKAAERADREALERAERQSVLRTELLTVFRFAVDGKARRVRRQVERRAQRRGVGQVRSALTPEPHLGELLQNLAVFFQQQLPAGDGGQRNFRVGVYINRNGVMTPVQAISLNDSSYTPFTSYQASPTAFRLDTAAGASHVVVCVRQRGMIVVEDCAAAAERGEFTFFRDEQRNYLRSMVAYYLGEVAVEDGTISEGALVIDTEASGFFPESDRDSLEFALREFSARLRLELYLIALLAPRGTNA